jgi:hypothetical protein
MSEAKHPGDSGPGYEASDLQPRAIAVFGIALTATVIVCLIVGVWIFDYLATRQARQDVPRSPLAKVEAPAQPRLQVSAPKDLGELRAAEDKILDSYDWVNRQAGTVRIPIDQAMRLLAERGLAASGQPSQPTKAKRK